MKFGIIEIGSTNTKAFIYDNGDLNDLGTRYIAFKNNYNINNCLLENDIDTLYNFIKEIKKEVKEIYAFGTSIFRKISEYEQIDFTKKLKEIFDVDFKIVSADEESYYTVSGVINNIDYNKKMAVVIGGGGSTEVAIIENKQIVNKVNLDFGAMDITDAYPELKEDIVKTDFNEIINYTIGLIDTLNDQADILVLAGGDYIYFYEKAKYEMQDNFIYVDINQPYLLDYDTLNKYDKDILIKSLDKIKEENIDNQNWWNGARGMRFCMNAVAIKLQSKYIVPTRINMIMGLVDEIKKNIKKGNKKTMNS